MAHKTDIQEEIITGSVAPDLPVSSAVQSPLPGIRNFHKVKDWLYRGGQPTREQFNELAAMGIKTVVCLRWGRKTILAEQHVVEQTGMKFVSIPLFYWQLPSKQSIHDFLALLEDSKNHPIFVHCLHGADRTGLLIGMYRLSRDNWGITETYAEMKLRGFHRFRIRHFKWILFDYAKRLKNGG